MLKEEKERRDKVIKDLKKRWNISNSGLGRMFKLSAETIRQVVEEKQEKSKL